MAVTLQPMDEYKRLFSILPILCLNIVTVSIRELIMNNLLLEMACKVNVGYNDTTCELIANGLHRQQNLTNENSEVQHRINQMLGWCLPINSITPIVLLLFLGNFSDVHKIRKPFLNLPTFGELLSTLCCVVCINFRESFPVETAGVAHFIIPALFGSSPMLYMAGFAYIADISAKSTRIIKITIMQICINVCRLIGMVLSGYLFKTLGYQVLIISCVLMLVVCLCYGIFIVRDSREVPKTGKLTLVRSAFHCRHVSETFRLLTTPKGSQRINILFILILNFFVVLVFTGEANVFFWFTQHTYGWTNSDYAYFQGSRSIINCLALAVAVPVFSKLLHFRDITIIVISLIDKIVANIICISVKKTVGVYISILVGMLTVAATSGIRSLSTIYVSEDDIGKTQSLLSIIEAIAAGLAAQVYNQGVYYYTRCTYQHAFLYLSNVVCMFGVVLSVWKYYKERQQRFNSKENLCKK